jgi:iron complex transport system ATP-binding protein
LSAEETFHCRQLGFAYGLQDATFLLPEKGLVAIAGPNGAGKSTLVGILAGVRRPYRGSCCFAGKELRSWPRHTLARRVAFLPQNARIEFPFTAEEVVFMGRTPHSSGWYDSPEDSAAVERAMQITDCSAFRASDFRSLSGGERQRVMLASALAQQPEVLLLDEPTTFLDLKHQVSMYRLLASLSSQMLVVTVTHDLSLVLRYADRVIVLEQGRVAADGAPLEVFTASTIARVFGVDVTVHTAERWIEVDPQGHPS